MGELVFFIAAIVEVYKNAEVVIPRDHPYAGASEFGAELVEASSREAFFGACHIPGRDRWVVGRLFGDVGYSDGSIRSFAAVFNNLAPFGLRERRQAVLSFPIALVVVRL